MGRIANQQLNSDMYLLDKEKILSPFIVSSLKANQQNVEKWDDEDVDPKKLKDKNPIFEFFEKNF